MRNWGIGVLVVAAACAVGGCGNLATLLPPQSVSDTKALDQSITSIKLDTHAGDVSVQGQAGLTKTTVVRTIKYTTGPAPTQDTYHVDGGVLTLSGDCGSNCSIDYQVTAPAGLPISGQATAGDITLAKVGAVDVGATSGDVELTDVTGTVKAKTTNGNVTGSGLKSGTVQANTTSGSVNLTLAEAADVSAHTTNGQIRLAVPGDSYRVSTDTHNGDRKIRVADDPAGKHSLDLTTDNGDIRVDHA
ncbi:DUF4097 family beta strand repeat-containing protein [Kutzneria sp. CA-103260]|uniref:DUF4097 family beta strand repeat-containing protein n=1 Tax=Kutzneria sp. CA-103260 TaxID=2802641 RepID=UPI001BAD14B4|nr:DUF4097 family beta strand repeat-containing protein [Kutzneria sp. CA-103260]QUQ67578.1 lipoprotein [Kutzneria sp. CA-103260]